MRDELGATQEQIDRIVYDNPGASSKTPPNAHKSSFDRRDGRMPSSVYTDKTVSVSSCATQATHNTRAPGQSAKARLQSRYAFLIHCTFMLMMSCAERLARLY